MQYRFLAEWTKENSEQDLIFHLLERFEDQYIIRFRKQRKVLQINLSSSDCFCFFTENKLLPFKDTKELSNFNDHLKNAKLNTIYISEQDRIILLDFSIIDIYNQRISYKLVLELIPRYQNIILLKDKIIIDCIKKISYAENRHRQLLPGVEYIPPPSDYEIQTGEVEYPVTVTSKLKIEETNNKTSGFSNMNTALEELYYNGLFKKRNDQLHRQKIAVISKTIKQKQRKIEKLRKELGNASKEEKWKRSAELLKVNFDKIKSGMEIIKLQNYYEEGFPEIEIKLDKAKHPKQNLEFYFKKYRKARDGKIKIAEQIDKTNNEIELLEKEIFDIEEVEFILTDEKQQKKKKSKVQSGYKKLIIDENWEIYIGRTSKENDQLTTRFAKPHDWWFHTRIFRGTHIILRNLNKKELPENLKYICCRLAAYYSKAKKSSNVPVDYTQIRYVRKPHGAAVGYVTYKNQKTLYVDPIDFREAAKNIKKLRLK
jgi:predicted ribosome quality control (RQC) complex YloA/Tae2 family protein